MRYYLPTLDKKLARLFAWYTSNYLVDYYPIFIAFPILLTSILAIGFIWINELTLLDARKLYTPTSAPAWTEEKIMRELWPIRINEFLPERTFEWNRYLYVVVHGRIYPDGTFPNILDDLYLNEIELLERSIAENVSCSINDDELFINFTTKFGDKIYFQDLCLNWYGECYRQTNLIKLLQNRYQLEKRGISITYPRANTNGTSIYLAYNIGGVEVDKNDTITSVKGMRLWYFLRFDQPYFDKMAIAWENAATKFITEKFAKNLLIEVHIMHSRTIDLGLTRNANRLKPYFMVTIVVLIFVSTLNSMEWKFYSGHGLHSAIGVDDMFIMVGAWHDTEKTYSGNDYATLKARMIDTLSESAVAIFITSFTDISSFAIGCLTDIIAVRGFCAMTSACLFFTFLYQLSIYGIMGMEQGLDYDKLLIKTDPIVRTIAIELELFHGGDQIDIAVVKAPDMTKPLNRKRVEQMVHDFEHMIFATGPKATQVWIREYRKYANITGAYLLNDHRSWIEGVYHWSRLFAFYKLWSQSFVWENEDDLQNLTMKSFRFRIGLSALNNPNDLVMESRTLREIAAKYSDMEIYTYEYSRMIADQLNIILPNTLLNDSIAVIVLVIIALLFIPNPICTFWIFIAIITMDIGVIGFLALWNVKLDPISMITVIMAIGFSIEYCAHITYGFVSNPSNITPVERCIEAMEKLAYPIIYGSMSTIFGVTVLAFINSYMMLVFFKTIFLVVIIGIFHALLLLPIILCITAPINDQISQKFCGSDDDLKQKDTTTSISANSDNFPKVTINIRC
ncbi:Patched domain-containing protein [Dirofilaria immitis]